MTLDDIGPGVTTQHYHYKGRLIMLEVNCIKFSLDIQNSLVTIMCKFHAFRSKSEGMAASVCVFLEHPSYIYNLIIHFNLKTFYLAGWKFANDRTNRAAS